MNVTIVDFEVACHSALVEAAHQGAQFGKSSQAQGTRYPSSAMKEQVPAAPGHRIPLMPSENSRQPDRAEKVSSILRLPYQITCSLVAYSVPSRHLSRTNRCAWASPLYADKTGRRTDCSDGLRWLSHQIHLTIT
ncbi:hypothetical protein K438DRAFT_1945712 [Mycena galopus ATCC 62051]|nr:hypothetical protein K438DRAFT_1945712 [Mycena galopus ATCC 62051]